MSVRGDSPPPMLSGERPRASVDPDDGRVVRVIREVGGANYPILNKTNYGDCSLVMKVMLEARGLWPACDLGGINHQDDRMALEALIRAVPPEMVSTVAVKATTKEAWDAIKTLRVGNDRVRKASAQKVRKEYETIVFREGETVDDFGLRLGGLVTQLDILGDPELANKVMEKFLHCMPQRFSQIVLSIETMLDVSALSMEEMVSRIKAAEDRCEPSPTPASSSSGKLYFTEEEWMARMLEHRQSSSGGGTTGRN